MSDGVARSHSVTLFVAYQNLLSRNGLEWIARDNGRIAVYHVLEPICLKPLLLRLELLFV